MWERRVDRVVVGIISSLVEDPRKCSLVRVHWGFREEEDIWGVEVHEGDHVGQGGALVAYCFVFRVKIDSSVRWEWAGCG